MTRSAHAEAKGSLALNPKRAVPVPLLNAPPGAVA